MLRRIANSFFLDHKSQWQPIYKFTELDINKCYQFALGMSFQGEGQHRNHRTGGRHSRRNGEIFANTFQGKLAELGLYNVLQEQGIEAEAPNFEMWNLGVWDLYDLRINTHLICIKSTKSYGNLLLLETADWNTQAVYLANNSTGTIYDFIFLTRIAPDIEQLLKAANIYFSDSLPKNRPDLLQNIIFKSNWAFDCPGFITRGELINLIANGHVIPQGSMLQGRIQMDADNYYCQSGNLHPLTELTQYLGVH